MILSVSNDLQGLPNVQYSYVSANISSGGTTIPVRNINSFTNQYAVQIGKTGEETSEIVAIGTPSGTNLPLASGTLRFDHALDTPIYNIHYDSIIFKRSTTGTAGTASAISTVLMTPDSQYTQYNDATGAYTYVYKTQFYNSVNSDVSSESDWFVPSGPSYYSLQKMKQRGKDALYNANYIKSEAVLGDWVNEWLELMTNSAIKVNQGYAIGTTSVAFGTAGLGTITDNDFKQAVKIEMTFDGNSYANSTEIPLNRWSPTDNFTVVYPRHYWMGDSVFGVLPTGVSGTARITYGKRNPLLINENDELPMSLRSYTTSCVNYILYRAYAQDTKPDLAEQYYTKFIQQRQDFISEITPRDQTGVKTIDLVEGISGLNDGLLIGSEWIL